MTEMTLGERELTKSTLSYSKTPRATKELPDPFPLSGP
jgi:hypothetical protein